MTMLGKQRTFDENVSIENMNGDYILSCTASEVSSDVPAIKFETRLRRYDTHVKHRY